MKTIKIAMLGFGSAGQAFVKILEAKREEIRRAYGCDPVVSVIVTRSRGSLINGTGVNLGRALGEIERQGRFSDENPDYGDMSALEAVKTAEYDVVMELTPLEIFSGEPAITHLKTAMNRGKHAITANKGPIAWAFRELSQLARDRGVCFYYETTVMDGTPVFNMVQETLPLCRVTEINGILNTTTNFVLEQLAAGSSYEDAMAEGRRRGFVEADPSMDIDGWDSAAKITALLNVLMDGGINPKQIQRTGISHITKEDLENAAHRGKVIKLLCHGEARDGRTSGWVKPVEVDQHSLWASISGTTSVVQITTDLMGTLSIVEHDPEIQQTGFGIFSDLLRVIRNGVLPYST